VKGYVRDAEPGEFPTRNVPAGFRLVLVDEFLRTDALKWRPPTPSDVQNHGCRWTVGPGHLACHARPVAMLRRNTRWFAYCEHHLYGRKYEDGRLLAAVLVKADEVAS
jgi:hypothetical protein